MKGPVTVLLAAIALAACGGSGNSAIAADVAQYVQSADGGFASIRGELKQSHGTVSIYASTVTMPGAGFCQVVALPGETFAGCAFGEKTESGARATFDKLVNAVRQAEPGWQYRAVEAPPKGALQAWTAGDDRHSCLIALVNHPDLRVALTIFNGPYRPR